MDQAWQLERQCNRPWSLQSRSIDRASPLFGFFFLRSTPCSLETPSWRMTLLFRNGFIKWKWCRRLASLLPHPSHDFDRVYNLTLHVSLQRRPYQCKDAKDVSIVFWHLHLLCFYFRGCTIGLDLWYLILLSSVRRDILLRRSVGSLLWEILLFSSAETHLSV